MKLVRLVLALVLLSSLSLPAQNKIVIPAGSPEDKALADISNEQDQQKRISMYEDFVTTYASNPSAVAYGNWQLSQMYLTSDPAKGMDYGDKALAAMPDVLEILQTQADLAQQAKNYSKVVDYACRGAVVYNNIAKQPKPEGVSDDEFKNQIGQQTAQVQPVYDYLAAAGYNAMAAEQDLQKRIEEINKYTDAFHGSKLSDNANLLAVATYQQLNDMPRLVAFGEKLIKSDPGNASVYTLLANAYAEDEKGANLAKADTYARKAIELTKSNQSMAADQREIMEGFAHEILGYSLMRQSQTAPAITELKTASTMLKGDAPKNSIALYRLGYAYAKLNKVADAKTTLAEAAEIDGPFKQAAKDMLAKLNASHAAKK